MAESGSLNALTSCAPLPPLALLSAKTLSPTPVGKHRFAQVLIITDDDKITVADLYGEILIEHTRPAPGITYVGNGRPRGPRPKTTEPSPKS